VEEKQRAQNKFAHPPLVVDKTLLPHVRIAKELVLLREEGRWLSVALGSLLRRALFREGDARGIEHELLFFATCSEVEEDTFDQIILTERQSEFNKWKNFTFPKTVTSIPFLPPFLTYAVSPGHAVGYLRRESDVIAQGDILLVDVLSPELTKYFDRIGGILAREGGILSHLAIVAREYGIPVVVDRRKDIVDALWGKEVSLSGDDGIVVPTR
jgi:phosphohistidine swiveling domain-containing protein